MNWLRNLPEEHQNAIKEIHENSKGYIILVVDPCYVGPIESCLKSFYNIKIISSGSLCEFTRKIINEFKKN